MTSSFIINCCQYLVYQLKSVLMSIWRTLGIFILLCIMYSIYNTGYISLFMVFLALLAFLYAMQDSLLYHPNQPSDSRQFVQSPEMYNFPMTDSKLLETSDSMLIHVMFMGQPLNIRNKSTTILFLHGNAGNIGHRLPNIAQLYYSCSVNILLLEYRGYGKSEGKPSEGGLYLDLAAGIDYLRQRNDVNDNKIVLMGRSLGGAVATSIANNSTLQDKVSAVILENTFTSIPNMAVDMFGLSLFGDLPRMIYKNKYESLKRIPKLTVPTLFLSGQKDTLVSPRMMHQLYMKSGSTLKEFVKLDGGHNDSWMCRGYYDAIYKFIVKVNGK